MGLDVKAIRTQRPYVATKHLSNSLKKFLRLVEISRSLDRRRVAELVALCDYEEIVWLIPNHLVGEYRTGIQDASTQRRPAIRRPACVQVHPLLSGEQGGAPHVAAPDQRIQRLDVGARLAVARHE